MFTAANARFITNRARVSSFVEFANSAFIAGAKGSNVLGESIRSVWLEHFQGTAYESDDKIFQELAAETLVARLVDVFQFYLADVLCWALWRRPEAADLLEKAKAISSSEGIELSAAVYNVAERKAEDIAYGGFRKIIETMQITFNVTFPISESEFFEVRRLIAVRNAAVHNQGKKNARYCKATGEPEENIGQEARLSLSEAQAAGERLDAFVTVVDETLSNEFIDFGILAKE